MTRKTFALVAATAVFSSGATVLVGQVAQPTSAAATAATDRQIVSELKKLNASIGANYKPSSVIGLLFDTKSDTDAALTRICRNTAPELQSATC